MLFSSSETIHSCQKLLQATKATLRDLTKIIGKIISIELAVTPTILKTRKLLRYKNNQLHVGWEGLVSLTNSARNKLLWWIENIQNWNGRTIILLIPLPEVPKIIEVKMIQGQNKTETTFSS